MVSLLPYFIVGNILRMRKIYELLKVSFTYFLSDLFVLNHIYIFYCISNIKRKNLFLFYRFSIFNRRVLLSCQDDKG
ncbi:MAG: hypothetical protein ACI9LM_002400 [Alteromonadaceae bacterium]|jgi:hypothetical protein